MNRQTMYIVLASTLLCAAALAHEGHTHATGVVKERMDTMTAMDQRLRAIRKRVRSNKEMANVTANAQAIHDLAAQIVSQFPPGSTQYPTAAKPSVWQDWPDFQAKAKALESTTDKLVAANATDAAKMRQQYLAVSQACDACHEIYRATKQ